MRPQRGTALLSVHGAVLLFGLAGVLGKMISLPATAIVLGRVVFGGVALAVFLSAQRVPVWPRRFPELLALAASGILLAVHWTTFFQSVRVSSVAVALLSFSTFPLFATVLEPLLLHEWPRRVDALAALLILPGIYFVVPSLSLANTTTLGAAWGLLAGLTFAVLSIWNRRLTRSYPSAVISLHQDAVAALVLLPTLLFVQSSRGVSVHDILVLFVLGVVCTALAHTLFIEGMRTLTAQTASVIAALEPVWGILFAWLLLEEIPTRRVLIGGILIVSAMLIPAFVRQPIAPDSSDVAGLESSGVLQPGANRE